MQTTLQEPNTTYPNGKKALQGVNASLDNSSLVGLLGPNGAGKSTLMRLLTAGLLPTGGTIRAGGESLTKCERAYRARLDYPPQDFGLLDEPTMEQFLDHMGALKGLRSGRENIRAVIGAVHLEEKRRARIHTLSGGQHQWVGIAQVLLSDPAFLISDEPIVGLDPEERIHFRNLFSRLTQDRLVLLSTHIIEDVQPMCSHLLVFHQGWLRFDGMPEEPIRAAEGHVDTPETWAGGWEDGLYIAAWVNTAQGVACWAVAETLPPYVRSAEPTLEDVYLYLISGEGGVRTPGFSRCGN